MYRAQGKYYGHVVRSPQAVGYQHACKIGHQDLVEARCNVACRAVATYEGELVPGEKRFGIVVSKFNDLITNKLLEGALAGLKRFGVNEDSIDVRQRWGAHHCTDFFKLMYLSMHLRTFVNDGAAAGCYSASVSWYFKPSSICRCSIHMYVPCFALSNCSWDTRVDCRLHGFQAVLSYLLLPKEWVCLDNTLQLSA